MPNFAPFHFRATLPALSGLPSSLVLQGWLKKNVCRGGMGAAPVAAAARFLRASSSHCGQTQKAMQVLGEMVETGWVSRVQLDVWAARQGSSGGKTLQRG